MLSEQPVVFSVPVLHASEWILLPDAHAPKPYFVANLPFFFATHVAIISAKYGGNTS